MQCPVCESEQTVFQETYRPYLDLEVDIFDCRSCNSRFAPRDYIAHEQLHQNASSYDWHTSVERQVKLLLDRGKIDQAKSFLSKRKANAFVMDRIERMLQRGSNLLEIGCSRGYLSGYFIARGYRVLGVDVAETAIQAAIKSFGRHFCTSDNDLIKSRAPYDAIYHVGTIGCVPRPYKMTMELLELLKPGGVMVFNAPNRINIDLSERMWLSTPPPDLVTLFDPGYWRQAFSAVADADVQIGMAGMREKARINLMKRKQNNPERKLFSKLQQPKLSFLEKSRQYFLTIAGSMLDPPVPSEYGTHVLLRKRK